MSDYNSITLNLQNSLLYRFTVIIKQALIIFIPYIIKNATKSAKNYIELTGPDPKESASY
jgi:hypothetical protein